MVISKFSSDNVYIPLTSENKSTQISKDGYASFKSAWGVWNDSTKIVDFNFNIDNKLIRNQLLSQKNLEDESVVIDKVKLNKLYYLPLLDIIDPPIGEAYWTHKGLTFNENSIQSAIDEIKDKIKLPKGSDEGQEWWKWFTNGGDKIIWDSTALGLSIAGTILSHVPGVGTALSWVSIVMTAISLGDSIISSVVSTVNEEYSINKDKIDDFSNTLINDGYEIELNKYLDLNKNNIINIWAEIQYKAKATAIFGDRTKVKVYEAVGLATTSVEWYEYVKK